MIRTFTHDDCPFIVYSDDDIAPADFQLSRALERSNTNELVSLGVSLIGNIASALHFLESKSQELIPFQISAENFTIFARSGGQYTLAFTPNTTSTSSTAYKINTELLQHLCSKTVTNATIATYPERTEELFYTNPLPEQRDNSQTSGGNASELPQSDTTEPAEEAVALRRLYSWQRDSWDDVTLREISAEFAPFCYRRKKTSLRRIVNKDTPNHTKGCPGYRRDEIRLSLHIYSSTIIIHNSPDLLEICGACGRQHMLESPMDSQEDTEDEELSTIFQDLQVPFQQIPDNAGGPPFTQNDFECKWPRCRLRFVNREACIEHEQQHMLELAEQVQVNERGGLESNAPLDSGIIWRPDLGHYSSPEEPALLVPDSGSPRIFGPRSPRDSRAPSPLELESEAPSVRRDTISSWEIWQPDPDLSYSPQEPTLLVPDRGSPGLFGPRSPRDSRSPSPLELESKAPSVRRDTISSWEIWHPDPELSHSPQEPTLLVPDRGSPGLFGPRSP
ncbi:hypothetical protein DL96DRAFT_265812 [Flagelloscypha sp. PMI_526]|nr:hypothetical protein DL96DRAFT_265812 [Flagelloscypha sp. PMI_526]